jgi:glyoxylase-like metal-dependent hydrolase (beta-lactamase superfamily II)
MIFRPFFDFEHGCAAYLFGCGGHGLCAVVDARQPELDDYIAFARDKGMRITHVFDTHVHADHLSGGASLAERVGAEYCLHRSADVRRRFRPLDDGEEIGLGNTRVRVLHTPGHTPESISLVVTDLRRGPAPWFVITGDTLFSGAVGRPDLPGEARENASRLYGSLYQKLLTLPDEVEVYPAHFGGSACGAGLSGKPSSTIGFERRFNQALSLDREAFIDTIAVVTPKPGDSDRILEFNRGNLQG